MRKIGRFSKGGTFFTAFVMAAGLAGTLATRAIAGPVVDGDMVKGETILYKVKKRQTLFDIARQYDLGIVELEAANPGINPWSPKPGTIVTVSTSHLLPTISHDGIVVNLDASRLYFFNGNQVMTFPVASGKEGWETPVAATKVMQKRPHPTWTIPADIRALDPKLPESVPPGPNNPLGQYALALGLDGIMIHGTNTPAAVGRHVSHGCIRLYPEDIDALFHAVKKGTPVLIAKIPYMLGWEGNKLYLEVPPKLHASKKLPKLKPDRMLHDAVARTAGNAIIDWQAVDDTMARGDGIPAVVGFKPLFGPPMPPIARAQAVQPVIAPVAEPQPAPFGGQTPLPIAAPATPTFAGPQRAALTVINDNNVSMR